MVRGMTASRFDPTPRIRGRKLMAMRALWFAQHPLCVMCKAQGRVSMATELDHIVPLFKGGTDEPNNFQSLCAEHHREKTNEDLGYRPSKRVGVDGVPEGWT
jgi:5-methylcytosine-specific restriction enzyme A